MFQSKYAIDHDSLVCQPAKLLSYIPVNFIVYYLTPSVIDFGHCVLAQFLRRPVNKLASLQVF